ncbi:hypothetical protein F5882DRAFT_422911 [Hyaloscypha sp. PMI_1271]|nr:hypothetical protein F5882DRAFT_422911 [Hyaloscypha sp. PMI_1271]
MVNVLKRRSQRLSKRKETLLKKSHEIAILYDVDVALFLRIRKSGHIITYNNLDIESWPLSREEMVTIHAPRAASLKRARTVNTSARHIIM